MPGSKASLSANWAKLTLAVATRNRYLTSLSDLC